MSKLIQMQCPPQWALFLVCALTLYGGCGGKDFASPPGYDLNRPVRHQLGKSLNEISGLTWEGGRNGLLAISDSKKKIVRIDPVRAKLSDWAGEIWETQDYEDVVLVDSTAWVLISDGRLVAVRRGAADTAANTVYVPRLSGKNDFESLYFDRQRRSLMLLCKNCEFEDGKDTRSAFRFRLDSRTYDSAAVFALQDSEVEDLQKSDDAKFRPSAAAIHPRTGELYILSSAGNLLVVADPATGKVRNAFRLNPDTHPQAEGLTFAPNGDMYITNEGKFGVPTLQVFPFRATKK